MAGRRFSKLRTRALDLALVVGGVVLVASPLMAYAFAAPPVIERNIAVEQTVSSSALISEPLAPSFRSPKTGKEVGSVKWDIFTSSTTGYKLAVSAKETPSLQGGGCTVSDMSSSPADWSVGYGQRYFGVSATGDEVLSAYSDGGAKRWRGLDGRRPIEVARYRAGAAAPTRTTVWLAAENNGFTDCSNAQIHLVGTVFVNL